MVAICEIRCEDSEAIGLFNRNLAKTIRVANSSVLTKRIWLWAFFAK